MTLRQVECVCGMRMCNFTEYSDALGAARALVPNFDVRIAGASAHFDATGSSVQLEELRDELLKLVKA
jgi:hypothetical protein